MIKDLILKNRSYRRFDQSIRIEIAQLKEWIDLARCSSSAANKQPLKYLVSAAPKTNATIFKHLSWAGYLKDWNGPDVNERPSGYVIICGDTSIAPDFYCDHGIAAQSILLGAVESGFGGCIIGSIKKESLRKELNIPDELEILLVLALGKPSETVVLEPLEYSGKIEYWRDEAGVHHVPKRGLSDIIIEI